MRAAKQWYGKTTMKEEQSQILKFARTEGRKLKQKMTELQKEIIQRKRVAGQKKIISEKKRNIGIYLTYIILFIIKEMLINY